MVGMQDEVHRKMYVALRQGDIRKVYKLVAALWVYEQGDLGGGQEVFQRVFQVVFLEVVQGFFLLLYQEQEFPLKKFLQV